MLNSEIGKKCDEIIKRNSKYEIKNILFDYFRDKENRKLNHHEVLEDEDKKNWIIEADNNKNQLLTFPFGFVFADCYNQLCCLHNKESFIAYCKRMKKGAKSHKEVNPTFDKMGTFYMIPFYDETPEEIFDKYNWFFSVEEIENDFAAIKEAVAYIVQKKPISAENRAIYYDFVHRFFMKFYLFIISAYPDMWEEDIKMLLDNAKDMDLEEHVHADFRYKGHRSITYTDNTDSFVRAYDMPNHIVLAAEDFARFISHQTEHDFAICPECGCMFAITHGNQKHCPACKDNIRQKQRKDNKARYLHKKITDYINTYSEEPKEESEVFRTESNYYWSLVQGKKTKTEKENWYQDIHTLHDYIEWLESKHKELKEERQ